MNHISTNCRWAQRKVEYFWEKSSALFHNNMWVVCQYEHVKYLIKSKWLDYNLLCRYEIKKNIDLELNYQNIYISSEVSDFIQDLLFEIFVISVSELINGLSDIRKIQSRGRVELREISTSSNIYLKLEDHKCIVVSTLELFPELQI